MKASRASYRSAVWLAAVCFFAAGAARLFGAPAQQGGLTLDAVLKQLDAKAADFKSLSADLERTKVTVVVNDKSTESGQIVVRRDDKMRIDITKPDERSILRDKDNFYIYNPKINRVEEYNLGNKKSVVDQFFLLGFGTPGSSLKDSYDVSLHGEETLDNRKTARVDLVPKTDEVKRQLSKIVLWLDESTWLPVQQQFFENGSGDYFIIDYRNVKRNTNIGDGEFKPRWLHGVPRVRPQG